MKTWSAKPGEATQSWWIVDATDKTLGRIATVVAAKIRGKHKPQFTPHVDTGDFVVVINVDKVKLTGNKLLQRKYFTRSRFFGSIKEMTAEKLLATDPVHMMEHAVAGMLPKTKLGKKLIHKLKAYKGSEHPHSAQKPQTLTIQH